MRFLSAINDKTNQRKDKAYTFKSFIYLRCLSLKNPIDVGAEKQLFIDDLFIESSEGVVLTVNQPRKTGEKLVASDKPWEHGYLGGYLTVMIDEGVYKMWYAVHSSDDNDVLLCFAMSFDGKNWIKPSLGIVEYKGSKDNNIVYAPQGHPYGECHGPTVFKDPNEPEGSPRKYKMFYWMGRHRPYVSIEIHGDTKPRAPWMGFAFSSDGLHWVPWEKNPVMKNFGDTQNVAFWDDRIGKYVAYTRMWYPWRKVGRSETSDLSSFPDPVVCFEYDGEDPENLDFYTSACIKYPYAENAYFMFPSAFYREPGERHMSGPLDIQLAVSRDGAEWSRPERRPFIRLGIDKTFDSQQIYVGVGITREGDWLSIYYTGYDVDHGAKSEEFRQSGVITRALIRVDGFVSADAGYKGGTLTTVPIIFSGNRLELNVDASAGGFVKVEILDSSDKPISGFTKEDSDVIRGNHITKLVTWKGNSDLTELVGKSVKIKFYMRDAKLYAFQYSKGEVI